MTADNTAEVTARYGDTGGFDWASEQRFGWRPWQEYSWNDEKRLVRTGTARQEFVSAGDSWWQQRVLHRLTWSWGRLTGGRHAAAPAVRRRRPGHRDLVRAGGPAGRAGGRRGAGAHAYRGHPGPAGGRVRRRRRPLQRGRRQRGAGHGRGPAQPGRAADRRPLRAAGRRCRPPRARPATGWTSPPSGPRTSGGGPRVPRPPGSSPRPGRPGTPPSRCRCCRWTTRSRRTCGARCPAAGRTSWG